MSNVFGSVLAQVGRHKPEVLQHVAPYKHRHVALVPQNDLSLQEINEILTLILPSLDCLYILVDALNETLRRNLATRPPPNGRPGVHPDVRNVYKARNRTLLMYSTAVVRISRLKC